MSHHTFRHRGVIKVRCLFESGGFCHSYFTLLCPIILCTMTKLLEWVFGVSLIGIAWGLVTFDLLDLQLPPQYKDVAWPMPIYLLVVFGCYSLATVGYRVATFNDCEDAAKELQAQIKEAKGELKKKGLKM
ncbi:Dolichol-phosphate mannosyltransferase subunit 3 [Triplophysa tibetana]|uniref:Dolichol-phosphate mannosyltransferase subunit 3 n=1 Tax=Triplophysa tibetana TaxID=1572043 RepID=A0A5A9NMC5_9TELE|nr:Dolichol-phosphate mannosyltransferase subunit 3 [Triplophysa tibetana]